MPRRPSPTALRPGCLLALTALALLAAGPAAARVARPSILLVVLDTVRADAVSAYGQVEGTTPVLDALAREGVRYARAYSASNWTVPAHAAMFTGLRPSVTGMLRAGTTLSGRHRTLAAAVALAGYDTAGFSENPWLSEDLGFHQGFDHFENSSMPQLWRDGGAPGRELPERVGAWLRRRKPDRPVFVFVNIMDAHDPYPTSADNPFLAPWVPLERRQMAVDALGSLRCATDARGDDLDLLRRLYLHGVHLADAKLGRVLEAVRAARPGENLRVIVVSDHGEHFGERRRVVHDLGLGEALLHVPLVIHGAPVVPAVIETPVPTTDVFGTIISWTGAWATGPGRVLPTRVGAGGPTSTVVAEYEDPLADLVRMPAPESFAHELLIRQQRLLCGPEDRAFGSRRAVVAFPYKLIAFHDRPPELFDVADDPGERRDLAGVHPEVVARLYALLPPFGTPGLEPPAPAPVISPARAEQLRALGYLVPEP